MKKIPLTIIAGPTGIGKSSLAMQIAENIGTDLISADSRQVYKYFDVGTAKPTKEEQRMIKHHLIDLREPTEIFAVAEYLKLVKPLIEDINQDGKMPLIVGGTGLYIKTLVEGFSIPEVESLPDLRKKLVKEAEEYGNAVIYQRAKEIDPEAMTRIHENDIIRVIRVLEVFENTGKLFSSLRVRASEPIYDLTYICLDMDREKLYTRIGQRVEQMFEQGLLDEVKSIIEKYGSDLQLLKTINYRETREHLLGNLNLEETKELMKKNTRNFAKRQLTWFRNDPLITFMNAETKEDINKIVKLLCNLS
ncbi:MAG: tRNA (adenosine(37)-N6)-dimethylallyltransferase MiaA [Candidatus Sericytochromatia bacterium]|nr:tRNA (adenosine(37)-N6)-dimethylallyltransferase MiaA [Candidatus Sericytochromatia bacterium]